MEERRGERGGGANLTASRFFTASGAGRSHCLHHQLLYDYLGHCSLGGIGNGMQMYYLGAAALAFSSSVQSASPLHR
jgi:hypothetical protein